MPTRFVTITGLMTWEEPAVGGGPPQPPLGIWGPGDPRPTLPIAGWNPGTGAWPTPPPVIGGGPGQPPLIIWGPGDPRPTLPIAGWDPGTGAFPRPPVGPLPPVGVWPGPPPGFRPPSPPSGGSAPVHPIAPIVGPGGNMVLYFVPGYGYMAVPVEGWGSNLPAPGTPLPPTEPTTPPGVTEPPVEPPPA